MKHLPRIGLTAGKLLSVTDPLGESAHFTYDAHDTLVRLATGTMWWAIPCNIII
ncbi:MAG: RHS repeat protein [Coriobacteriia bacterium]|nr:RHS repeat protein [Coriobacteriia bacterium]